MEKEREKKRARERRIKWYSSVAEGQWWEGRLYKQWFKDGKSKKYQRTS